MTDVVLIGCGSSKAAHEAPAKDLYVGNLFRARRLYAEMSGKPWAIISARHGVIDPDIELEPYDETVPRQQEARHWWALNRRIELNRWLLTNELVHIEAGSFVGDPLTVEIHAGAAYTDALVPIMDQRAELPLQGLGIGQQLSWYSKRRQLALELF